MANYEIEIKCLEIDPELTLMKNKYRLYQVYKGNIPFSSATNFPSNAWHRAYEKLIKCKDKFYKDINLDELTIAISNCEIESHKIILECMLNIVLEYNDEIYIKDEHKKFLDHYKVGFNE